MSSKTEKVFRLAATTTVREALRIGIDFLEQFNVPNSKTDAEWLLSTVLGCSRLELYVRTNEKLSSFHRQNYEVFIQRKANREPLQYIIGTAAFGDLLLKVSPDTLIPRPETEELIELIDHEFSGKKPRTILDLGTGSGAIILALGKIFPDAALTAVDLSEGALEIAKENAQHVLQKREIQFFKSNWFENMKGTYDLIVANPPYLTEEEWDSAQPEVRDFEPKTALTAPHLGCQDLEIIITNAPRYLNPDGALFLETGIAQHEFLSKIAHAAGFRSIRSWQDLHHRPRFLELREFRSA